MKAVIFSFLFFTSLRFRSESVLASEPLGDAVVDRLTGDNASHFAKQRNMSVENPGFISYKNANTVMAETVSNLPSRFAPVSCASWLLLIFPLRSLYVFQVYQFLYGMVYGAAWGCVSSLYC
jgi:hypothetical protein